MSEVITLTRDNSASDAVSGGARRRRAPAADNVEEAPPVATGPEGPAGEGAAGGRASNGESAAKRPKNSFHMSKHLGNVYNGQGNKGNMRLNIASLSDFDIDFIAFATKAGMILAANGKGFEGVKLEDELAKVSAELKNVAAIPPFLRALLRKLYDKNEHTSTEVVGLMAFCEKNGLQFTLVDDKNEALAPEKYWTGLKSFLEQLSVLPPSAFDFPEEPAPLDSSIDLNTTHNIEAIRKAIEALQRRAMILSDPQVQFAQLLVRHVTGKLGAALEAWAAFFNENAAVMAYKQMRQYVAFQERLVEWGENLGHKQ